MSMAAASGRQGLTFIQKVLRFDWSLFLVICAVAAIGFLMLYSVAGGDFDPWAGRQITRFGVGVVLLMVIALIDIRFWRWFSPVAYIGALGLLVAVEFVGT
ncbi:MAG: FtsW/RodA/SpoVE family cell cycle protein, partial [Pseudomonadota bacterium]